MSILRSRAMPAAAMAALVILSAWFFATRAGAATVTYPSGNMSNFATGNGGWTSSTEYGGVCVPAVTCPELSGSYQSSGGAAGESDGYIRTDSGELSVASLLSTSTHTWKSPAFTYNGVSGANPDSLHFSVGVNPDLAELLNLGANVEITAKLTGVVGGGDQTVIDGVTPGSASGWKTLNGQIGPDALEVGKRYRVELSVSFGGLATVLPAGSIGFDDVSLRASGTPANGNGNGGSTVLPPPKVIPAGVAYLYRNKLYIRVKCPRAFRPRCHINLVALTKRQHGRKLTPVRRANVLRGRVGRKVLGVKRPFRVKVRKMAKAKRRIIVRQKIKSKRGRKHAIRYQRLRVVIRARK